MKRRTGLEKWLLFTSHKLMLIGGGVLIGSVIVVAFGDAGIKTGIIASIGTVFFIGGGIVRCIISERLQERK